MIYPHPLQKGDTIAIICASGYLPLATTLQAQKVLTAWGYHVVLGATTQTEYHYFSAPDALRCSDLQAALDDPNVKAILLGRGGYGLSRIIDDINFDKFSQQPKWIWGFSDVTVLHSHIQKNFDIPTLHAPMCSAFAEENLTQQHMQALKAVLEGQAIVYRFPAHESNILGTVEGKIVGGNLCILDHLSGSISQLDTTDAILFIEDIGEHLYKVDRMLYNLKRSGQLKHIRGLICGNFTDMEDTTRPFGKTLYELIIDHVADMNIPVAFDIPIGHETINYPLVLGDYYEFQVQDNGVSITQLKVL